MKVYVTKYALTEGIWHCPVKSGPDDKGYLWITAPWGGSFMLARGEWHPTLQEAIARVDEVRANRLASLQKSIKKLQDVDKQYKVTEVGGVS